MVADFVLRGEVEAMRAASWAKLADYSNSVITYNTNNPSDAYPEFMAFDEQSLKDMGLEAAVSSARLNKTGEIGKLVFRILLSWEDRSGKIHEEARVLVITEGGFSADS